MAQKMISAQDLKARLDSGDDIMVVDTLVPEHFERMHIPGAKQACVYEINFMDQMAEIAPDKSALLVLYGSSPHTHTAFSAEEKLERAGYANVLVLQGGLQGWREAGYELGGRGGRGTRSVAG